MTVTGRNSNSEPIKALEFHPTTYIR